MRVHSLTIAFVTTNGGWGGSELLWQQAACAAARQGIQTRALACYALPDRRQVQLRQAGADLTTFSWPGSLSRFASRIRRAPAWRSDVSASLLKALQANRPDLVVISQGNNIDGIPFAEACRHLQLPYALLVEQASERGWPPDDQVERMRTVYQGARRTWFVSQHNQELTEFAIGCRLPNASVVRNPTGVDPAQCSQLDWPATEPVWRLACVARLAIRDKGQDLLIQTLALPHWRQRPLQVSICGEGPNAGSLQRLAELLDVRCLHFTGHTDRLEALWRQHHALILPSRVEGLPLALVEAMLCGRPAIATRVAGIPEVLDDGATGFLAAAPTVEHLDEALQRAWAHRQEWQAMGQEASRRIRHLMPAQPAEAFLDEVRAAAQVL